MMFYNFFSFWLWIVLIRRKRTNAFLGWTLQCFLSDAEQEPFLYTSSGISSGRLGLCVSSGNNQVRAP